MPVPDSSHFDTLAESAKAGLVVLYGAGINYAQRPAGAAYSAGANFLPTGRELAEYLAEKGNYPDHKTTKKLLEPPTNGVACNNCDFYVEALLLLKKRTDLDLARVAQYAEAQKAYKFRSDLHDICGRDYPVTLMHQTLAALPAVAAKGDRNPPIFLTTNYDTVLEQALGAAGHPFDVIYYRAPQDLNSTCLHHWRNAHVYYQTLDKHCKNPAANPKPEADLAALENPIATLDNKRNEEARLTELKREEAAAEAANKVWSRRFKHAIAAFSAAGLAIVMLAGGLTWWATAKRNEALAETRSALEKSEVAAQEANEAMKKAKIAEEQKAQAVALNFELRSQAETLNAGLAKLDKDNKALVAKVEDLGRKATNNASSTVIAGAVAEIKASAATLQQTARESSETLTNATDKIDDLSGILRLPAATVLPDQPDRISDVQFLATTPPLLATGSMGHTSDGTTRLFSTDGTLVKELKGDTAVIRGSPDGNWLLTLPWGKNVFRVHDRQRDWKRFEFAGGSTGNGSSAAFSPDGQWLALGWASSVQIWDWRSPPASLWAWRDSTALSLAASSIAFAPDGQRFVAGCDDNHFAVFALPPAPSNPKDVKLWRKETVHAPLRGPVFSPDGNWLLVPNGSTTTFLYPTDNADSQPIELKNSTNVIGGSFSPSSRWIVTHTIDRKINVWRFNPQANPIVSLAATSASICGTPPAFSWRTDGNTLATAGNDGAVLVWDTSTFDSKTEITPATTLLGHRKAVHAVQYSRDNRYLASGDDSGMVRLWDFQNQRVWQKGRLNTFGGPKDQAGAGNGEVALIPDWKVANSLPLQVFLPHTSSSPAPSASQLDPATYYIAMRWDYKLTPAAWLRTHPVRVMNLQTGLEVEAQPVDWGPALSSGLLMHVSAGLIKALNLKTNDEAAVFVPESPIQSVMRLLRDMGLASPRPEADISKWFAKCEVEDTRTDSAGEYTRTAKFVDATEKELGVKVKKVDLLNGFYLTAAHIAELVK